MEDVTESEWKEWIQDPTTKRILNLCRREIANQQTLLSSGSTVNIQSTDATALQTTMRIGIIRGMSELLDTLEGQQHGK